MGFFLESKQAPEIITELLAHMGISVSSGSLHNMVNSLSKKVRRRLRSLPHSNTAYDNLDFDFQKGQPTAENIKQHLSISAGTFVPYKNIDHDHDLHFVKELYATSPYNESATNVIHPQIDHILPAMEDPSSPQALGAYFAWFCRQILVT